MQRESGASRDQRAQPFKELLIQKPLSISRLQVELSCDAKEELTEISDPSRCVYGTKLRTSH